MITCTLQCHSSSEEEPFAIIEGERDRPPVADRERENKTPEITASSRLSIPLHTAPNHYSVQGSINSDVMLVGEVGGDGSAVHPWVSSAFLC